MEHLDELSLGIKGQIMGKNKDHPPVASPNTADHTASMSNTTQTLFDALHKTLVHLGPAIRWEQDPTLSESISWDFPPGAPLRMCRQHLLEVMHPDATSLGH